MRHAILSVFLVTLCAVAAPSAPYATASDAQQPVSGVVWTRLGNLRRDDKVVVDIPAMEDLQLGVASATGRLDVVESGLASVTGRVGVVESDLSSVTGRVFSLEAAIEDIGGYDIPAISGLLGRMDEVESGMSSATGRVAAVESDLYSVTGRVAAVESDLYSVTERVGVVEEDLASVTGRVGVVEFDLSELTALSDSRWLSTVASLEDLSLWATNTFSLVGLAHSRAKALEAWQYTNAVSRADFERGVTDWAVTPMWPLGRVVVAQVEDGPSAGQWALFRTDAPSFSEDYAVVSPVSGTPDAFGYVTLLEWHGVQRAVPAVWTNELDAVGVQWQPQPGSDSVVATFDVRARRTRFQAIGSIQYVGGGDPLGSGTCMSVRSSTVVSTNDTGVVSTNTYPVLTLYSDGVKVWTSDPFDSTNYGWLVALVLALVGSAGGVLWRYVAKSSAAAAVADVERALDDIIAGMDQDPAPEEGSGPSVPGVSDVVGPGGTEGD